jgi:site-specific recombinase XerC
VEDTPKSHKVRSVPLIDQAARALDGLSRRERFTGDDDHLFVSEAGDHLSDDRLRRRFKAAIERAGLPPMRLPHIRHARGAGVPAV